MSDFKRPGQDNTAKTAEVTSAPTAAFAAAAQTSDANDFLAALSLQPVQAIGEGTIADFMENIAEIEKSDTTTSSVKLAFFPDAELALPAIAFYKVVAGKVRFYSIIPEGLLYSPMEMQEEYIQSAFGNSAKVEIDFPVSKCWNEEYIIATTRALSEKLNVKVEDIKPTHYFSVSKEQDLTSKQFASTAYNTARIAINESFTPTPVIDHTVLNSSQAQMTVNTDICPGTNVTFGGGESVAADAVITTVISTKGDDRSQRGNPHSNRRSLQLAKIALKFGLLRTPVANQAISPQAIHAGTPIPEYHKLMIITGSEGYDQTARNLAENPMSHILGAVSAGLLASGENWQSIFTAPKLASSVRKSLGLLGYEYEPFRNMQFDSKEKVVEHTLQPSKKGVYTFQSIADSYLVPDSMTLAIDIKKGGRESWAQQLLLAAARRLPGANQAIIAYLDKLTGGHFSDLWKQASPDGEIFQAATTTIHMGHYHSRDVEGGVRDIREIQDHLYMIDILKEQAANPEAGLTRFSETFFPGATDDADGLRALHTRREDIKQIEPSAVVTDLADRLFFSPAFQSVATMALAKAGVKLNPQGLPDAQVTSRLAASFQHGQAVDYATSQSVFRADIGGHGGATNGYNHGQGPVYYS